MPISSNSNRTFFLKKWGWGLGAFARTLPLVGGKQPGSALLVFDALVSGLCSAEDFRLFSRIPGVAYTPRFVLLSTQLFFPFFFFFLHFVITSMRVRRNIFLQPRAKYSKCLSKSEEAEVGFETCQFVNWEFQTSCRIPSSHPLWTLSSTLPFAIAVLSLGLSYRRGLCSGRRPS